MKRLLLFALTLGLMLPFAAPAQAAAGCNGESSIYISAGQIQVQAVANGEPLVGAPVSLRDTRTGQTYGSSETDEDGHLTARLGPDLAPQGAEIEILISLSGRRVEQCFASIPAAETAPSGPVSGPETAAPEPVAPALSGADLDPALVPIFQTLYASGFGPGFRQIYERIGVPVQLRQMPIDIFGAYNGVRIALNSRYAGNREGLATVLAHELTHAQQDFEGRLVHPPSADPENCFAAEFEATYNDARVWLSLFPDLRPPRDALDRDLNRTAAIVKRSGRAGVERLIRDNYQEQCLGDQYGGLPTAPHDWLTPQLLPAGLQ